MSVPREQGSLSCPLLHPQFQESVRRVGSTRNITWKRLESGGGSVSRLELLLFPHTQRPSALPVPCQLFLPLLSSEEAVPPSPHSYPRWLCRAASLCGAVRAVNWVLECTVGRACIHSGNIHLHTKIWQIWKVRWEQLLLCVHRPGSLMSHSTALNKTFRPQQ